MSRYSGQLVLLVIVILVSCAWSIDHRSMSDKLESQKKKLAELSRELDLQQQRLNQQSAILRMNPSGWIGLPKVSIIRSRIDLERLNQKAKVDPMEPPALHFDLQTHSDMATAANARLQSSTESNLLPIHLVVPASDLSSDSDLSGELEHWQKQSRFQTEYREALQGFWPLKPKS